jgi:hypothetical protein
MNYREFDLETPSGIIKMIEIVDSYGNATQFSVDLENPQYIAFLASQEEK